MASGSRRRKSGWLPPRNQRQPSQAPQGLRAASGPSQRINCAARSASASLPTPWGPCSKSAWGSASSLRLSDSKIGSFQGCMDSI